MKLKHRVFSIHALLMAAFSAVIAILIFLVTTGVALLLEHTFTASAASASQLLLEQTSRTMDTYYTGLRTAVEDLAHHSAIQQYCMDLDRKPSQQDSLLKQTARETAASALRSRGDLVAIFAGGSSQAVMTFVPDLSPAAYTPLLAELRSQLPTEPYAVLQLHPIYTDQRSALLPVSLLVRNLQVYDTRNYGFVLFFFRCDELDALFGQMNRESGYQAFLVDPDGSIYYSTDHSCLGSSYERYLQSRGAVRQSDLFHLDENGSRLMMEHRAPLPQSGMELVLVRDMTPLHSQLRVARLSVLGLSLVLLAVLLTIAYILIRRITAPVASLSEQMENMTYEGLSKKVRAPYSCREIDRLYTGYNHMLDRIEALIDEIYYEKLRQKEAQYEALQARINPHFLCNTLQSISSLAILDRSEDIETAIEALSGMLEYVTYETGSQVALRQELQYVRQYLQIQNLRYNGRFSCTWQVEQACLSCPVQKLLLQPLVENAILHGLESREDGGSLTISARTDRGTLILEVADDGCGMEPEALEQLREKLCNSNKDSRSKSIGLSNIQERIHLKYGSSYGLTITASPGQGTLVRITLPAQPEQEVSDV